MSSRGKIPRLPDQLHPPNLLENEVAAQAAEIERILAENRILATGHLRLREDVIVAQKEVERLKAHLKSIQTESDIQVRILQDKIVKMEMEIRGSENVKNELRQAHMEAQSLAKVRQELTNQIDEASIELQRIRTDVKSLPDLHDELLMLRKEHKRLRETFEFEKSSNMEKVEQLKAMEQDLIKMAREVESLYDRISNAEKGSLAYGDGVPADAYGRPTPRMEVGSAGSDAGGGGAVV